MPEPEIIQLQRELIRDFLTATAQRFKAKKEAKEQFKKEQAEAKKFLEEQEQRRQQMESEAQKRYDADRNAADDAWTQTKGHAADLLRQAQTALQEVKDVLVDFPHPITFNIESNPDADTGDDPSVQLQHYAKQARQASMAVQEAVHAWEAWKTAREIRRKNIRYSFVGIVVLMLVIVPTVVKSLQIREQTRQATATAMMQNPTSTAMAQMQATTTAVAQATSTEAGRATTTAVAQAKATTTAVAQVAYLHDLNDHLGREFVFIPAGEFAMGSYDEDGYDEEHPQHVVYVDAYRIDKTEVTNAQYQQCVNAKVCRPHEDYGSNFNGPNQPVVGVNWNDAQTFCQWVGFKLPTEAQWEKAARGTDGRNFPWGNDWDVRTTKRLNFADKQADLAWSDREADDGYQYTAPVGSYPAGASAYGALDMAGNVWEWVEDWFDEGYYARTPYRNPAGPSTGNEHVLRGGSWADSRDTVSVTVRNRLLSDERYDHVGFRCVSLSP